MANDFFRFKQFTVWHDSCAMKVGTDGVLLGAWAPATTACRILDVGTGSGLIALMCAQRNQRARISAIDIDENAVLQTKKNVSASPWHERIDVQMADFQMYKSQCSSLQSASSLSHFDMVVSNPPYFQDSLKCPDAGRATARHTDSLPFEILVQNAYQCLVNGGVLAVVLPLDAEQQFMALAEEAGFSMQRITRVCTKVGKAPKRVLMSFRKGSVLKPVLDTLCILDEKNQYSKEYKELTEKFYL